MSSALNLFSNNLQVYGPSTLPCLGVSGRAVGISPCPQSQRRTLHMSVTSPKCYLRHKFFVCKARFGGQGRDSDFSRQNRHGFSRSWARLNDERGDSDDLGESESLSAKNEQLPSHSNSEKHHGIAAPRPRNSEIVERLRKVDELFRKVEARLGGRAAVKGEKRSEAGKEQNNEIEKNESFLQLLAEKLAVEQEKRRAEKELDERSGETHSEADLGAEAESDSELGMDLNSGLELDQEEDEESDEESLNSVSHSELDERSGETHSEPDLGAEAESDSELGMDLNSGPELDQEEDEEEELEEEDEEEELEKEDEDEEEELEELEEEDEEEELEKEDEDEEEELEEEDEEEELRA